MIGADLRRSADHGEPVGILIASEYPIYGRFGYGAAIEGASYRIDVGATRFRRSPVGDVELVDLKTLRRDAPPVYERVRRAARRHRPGPAVVGPDPAPGRGAGGGAGRGLSGRLPLPVGPGRGLRALPAKQEWDHMRKQGTLTVDELVAATPEAYERLWRYCCEVDLVSSVQAGDRPVDETLPWLLADGRAVRQGGRFDFVWVRILDVSGALEARRYAVEGRLVIEVSDDLGMAAGRVALEGGPDGASCARSTEDAHLSMPVDTLGSLYAGGVSAHALHQTGRMDEHRPGAVAQAERMFRSPVVPWCSTWF